MIAPVHRRQVSCAWHISFLFDTRKIDLSDVDKCRDRSLVRAFQLLKTFAFGRFAVAYLKRCWALSSRTVRCLAKFVCMCQKRKVCAMAECCRPPYAFEDVSCTGCRQRFWSCRIKTLCSRHCASSSAILLALATKKSDAGGPRTSTSVFVCVLALSELAATIFVCRSQTDSTRKTASRSGCAMSLKRS